MKTLYLSLKKEWYEMIERGEKKEEYREIKPYWEKRLLDYNGILTFVEQHKNECLVRRMLNLPIRDIASRFPRGYEYVRFSYGYTKRTMTFRCEGISIGYGKQEWGAVYGKPVFIISLGERIKEG